MVEPDSAPSALSPCAVYIVIVEPDLAPSVLSHCAVYVRTCGGAKTQQILAEFVEQSLSKSLLSFEGDCKIGQYTTIYC